MSEILTSEIKLIVGTLLHVGGRVLEISRDHVITRIWERDDVSLRYGAIFKGSRITDPQNNSIIRQCDKRVETCFATGKNDYFECRAINNKSEEAYSIRILPIHPDKKFLFIIIENLSAISISLIEDNWKLELDTRSDGVWDHNLQTDKIIFSDKWHEIFGYRAEEIKTGEEWAAKIHPQDRSEEH